MIKTSMREPCSAKVKQAVKAITAQHGYTAAQLVRGCDDGHIEQPSAAVYLVIYT